MFQRAIKVSFNEQKYLHRTIVRLRRVEDHQFNIGGVRSGLILSFGLACTLIKWYRKSGTHKVCYTPLRNGFHQLKNDPYYQAMDKGGVYGAHKGAPGRATLFG